MLLLQIEVNKGKMPYLSVSLLWKQNDCNSRKGLGGGGGGYSSEFEVGYHVLLLYYVVNFIRETSASGT